jgi:succinoglycan biosynthesis protein ExoO
LPSTPHADARPLVSVVMAVHNGGAYLRDAALSVLGQSHPRLELILCDDGSTDDAPTIAGDLAARDNRVRVMRSNTSSGPGAARNRGLEAALGDWIAIVDADDLLHPDRIAGLLAVARDQQADVVADDLVRFGAESGSTLLGSLRLTAPWRPDARALLRADQGNPPVPVGYLKPLIRRARLGDLRYRVDLPIGEDFDLLLRLALSGARIAVVAEPWYLYRRHGASTSHRLNPGQCTAIEGAIDDLAAAFPEFARTAEAELSAWRGRILRARDFGDLVEALKRHDFGYAAGRLRRAPGLWGDLARAAREGLGRRLHPPVASGDLRPLILTAQTGKGRGVSFPVPDDGGCWNGARAAALAKLTGSGRRHLRAVGRPGLRALAHVPGWRLAELIPPPDGWSAEEEARIAALPWPVLHVADMEAQVAVSVRAGAPPRPV